MNKCFELLRRNRRIREQLGLKIKVVRGRDKKLGKVADLFEMMRKNN